MERPLAFYFPGEYLTSLDSVSYVIANLFLSDSEKTILTQFRALARN